MKIEIKIPSVGESVKEAVLVEWFRKSGDRVQKDEPLFLIEIAKSWEVVFADVCYSYSVSFWHYVQQNQIAE